jgi:hypothetical protein
MQEIKPGQKWRHFKGGTVEIVCTALDSETLEELVVYKHLEAIRDMPAGQTWVRAKKMFLEEIEKNGKKTKRFELIK